MNFKRVKLSELRQDPTTKEWVILALERGKRPQHKPRRKITDELPDWDETCPFCIGNEHQTPSEVFRIPLSGSAAGWGVRVVPNRFAALTPGKDSTALPEQTASLMREWINTNSKMG